MAVSAVEESIKWNPTIPQDKKQTLIGLENLANVQQRILQQKKNPTLQHRKGGDLHLLDFINKVSDIS